jgi:uncharacterized membrane protein
MATCRWRRLEIWIRKRCPTHLQLDPDNGREFVARTITINRRCAELYEFWRDFRRLPRFMENLQSVSVADDVPSDWVALTPAAQTVDWDLIPTEDKPRRLIAWASAVALGVQHSGRVDFRKAPERTWHEVPDTPSPRLGGCAVRTQHVQ